MLRLFALCLCCASPVLAQGTGISLGGLTQDTSAPVEVVANELQVNQTDGQATFIGDVLVTQGDMKLSADRILVDYATGGAQGRIEKLTANGSVTLITPEEAAESRAATYVIDTGEVVMTGDVLLTQGDTALAGEKLTINLETGTGQMSGRVRTVFQTKSGQ
ncbi:lipopolysaccharide transport periplasmic protein LptA [Palleronia caenipelagi]|uniref:Lipopolysaccharide transport periplasmic protein LptA n=1 Tax=Palleronia caenipelagi TaxID=2489174 RepID=A0A547Q8I4_9RHOB|nr:lipopolysaccharide transport periplasmic protein LptA [Palleronia caenipelagi]TRD22695.1 lipopolysaccharide transport periplasmic protein LptA [Palleronia caenipelagi]